MRTRRASGAIVLLLALTGALTCAGEAAAITPTVNQFNLPSGGSVPLGLTTGSDGNLWFTDPAFTPQIGQLNPDTHAAVEFGQADGLQANSVPRQIAPGRDGNLWFTDSGCAGIGACEIGTINPTTHAITEFSTGLNLGASPEGIAAGPDDNLWFTDRGTPNAIGSINPSTHAIAEFSTGLESGDDPGAITAGPDGNLWFTDAGSTTTAIGTINPGTHTITKFGQANGLNAGSIPRAITAGPDGNLWFADAGVTPAIGTINPTTHAITEFSAGLNPGSAPNFIAAGPDGDLWFTDNGSTNAIGRIDPRTGAIAEFSKDVDQSGSGPVGITAGPDGNMWFADRGSPSSIVRVTTPPTAETISAHPTGATSATVSGKADGHAQPTSFAIEFGPVGAPTAKTPDQSLGTMSGVTAVSTALGGLRPKTAYRARVIVTNPTDTTAGAFLTFMTPQARRPNTRITKKKISSRRHRATLVFRAIGTASSFQCELRRARAHKKAKFRLCRSPKTYKHLRAGRYTFSVRAIGPGGRDLSPAKAKFKIKPE